MVEMIEAAGFLVESVNGSWPLTTIKMRMLRAASGFLLPSLAREGVFRQYVVVATMPRPVAESHSIPAGPVQVGQGFGGSYGEIGSARPVADECRDCRAPIICRDSNRDYWALLAGGRAEPATLTRFETLARPWPVPRGRRRIDRADVAAGRLLASASESFPLSRGCSSLFSGSPLPRRQRGSGTGELGTEISGSPMCHRVGVAIRSVPVPLKTRARRRWRGFSSGPGRQHGSPDRRPPRQPRAAMACPRRGNVLADPIPLVQ